MTARTFEKAPIFIWRGAVLLVLGAFLAVMLQSNAKAADEDVLVQKARNVVVGLKSAETKGDTLSFKRNLAKAKGVVIIPELVKAGFILGGEGGSGVVVGRNRNGQWSHPGFVTLLAASFGLQIGVQVSEVVFLVMTERGLTRLLKDKVKLGADAGIAVATVGVGVEGSTSTAANADILAFSRSKGLFGGVSFEGAVLQMDEDSNRTYYGQSATTREIVQLQKLSNPKAEPLRQALSTK